MILFVEETRLNAGKSPRVLASQPDTSIHNFALHPIGVVRGC